MHLHFSDLAPGKQLPEFSRQKLIIGKLRFLTGVFFWSPGLFLNSRLPEFKFMIGSSYDCSGNFSDGTELLPPLFTPAPKDHLVSISSRLAPSLALSVLDQLNPKAFFVISMFVIVLN